MATKRKTRRGTSRPRRLFGEGVYFEFHGAFKSEAKAKARARLRGGFYVKRGGRYVVMLERTSPF